MILSEISHRLEHMNTYMVICSVEDEDPFFVDANSLEEAKTKALEDLGWHIIQTEDDLDKEQNNSSRIPQRFEK